MRHREFILTMMINTLANHFKARYSALYIASPEANVLREI